MTKEIFIAANIQEGELYAGLILGKAGAADYHLFLLPGQATDVQWQAAMDWASARDAHLPTRREQALLFANLKEEFEPRWYWSGEQSAPSSSNAWIQLFNVGSQNDALKSYEGRARAVRRLEI